MHYLFLVAAIIFEVTGTTLLAYSDGFTKLGPGIASIVLYAGSTITLAKALLSIDLGVAYATWCSVGIVATAILGTILFGQRLNTLGIISIVLIMTGCVILNLYGSVK